MTLLMFGSLMGVSCWLVMVQSTSEPAHVTEDLLRTRPIQPWALWVAGGAFLVGVVLCHLWWRAFVAERQEPVSVASRPAKVAEALVVGLAVTAGPLLAIVAAPDSEFRWRPLWLIAGLIGLTGIAIARDRLGPRPAQRAWAWWTKPQHEAPAGDEPAGQGPDRRS